MGAIKDVVDLATQLSERIQDREVASELFAIIKLINTIQKEQAILTEKNIELMTDNSRLENINSSNEATISELKKKITNLQNPDMDNTPEVSEIALNILKFSAENREGVTAAMIEHKFNISPAKSNHQIGKLEKDEMIDCSFIVIGEDIRYSPTQKGLDVLDMKGLI